MLEDLHDALGFDLVVEVKQQEGLFHLLLQVDRDQLGALEDVFERVELLDTLVLEQFENFLYLGRGLGQDSRVLNNQSLDGLQIEAVFVNEQLDKVSDACLPVFLPKEESRLVLHDKADFGLGQAEPLVGLALELPDLRWGHVEQARRDVLHAWVALLDIVELHGGRNLAQRRFFNVHCHVNRRGESSAIRGCGEEGTAS